jgi:hypothetical protein
MGWWRRHYGAGPLHLVGLLACFAVAAYAVTRVLDESGWTSVFQWFVGCLVLHDLIGWPIYTAADRLLLRAQRRRAGRPRILPPDAGGPTEDIITRERLVVPWANHVRFPTVISAVLLAMFFPLIFRLSGPLYVSTTGFNENAYLTNWLIVTGIVFAGSAVIYLLRVGRAHKRAGRGVPPLEPG